MFFPPGFAGARRNLDPKQGGGNSVGSNEKIHRVDRHNDEPDIAHDTAARQGTRSRRTVNLESFSRVIRRQGNYLAPLNRPLTRSPPLVVLFPGMEASLIGPSMLKMPNRSRFVTNRNLPVTRSPKLA